MAFHNFLFLHSLMTPTLVLPPRSSSGKWLFLFTYLFLSSIFKLSKPSFLIMRPKNFNFLFLIMSRSVNSVALFFNTVLSLTRSFRYTVLLLLVFFTHPLGNCSIFIDGYYIEIQNSFLYFLGNFYDFYFLRFSEQCLTFGMSLSLIQ